MGRRLTSDLTLKLLAVILAVVLWFQATGERTVPISRQISGVEVELENLPEGFTVMDLSPVSIDLRVEGRREDLSDLRPEDFRATVDMAGAIEGTNRRSVLVTGPPRVEIRTVSPAQVEVELELLVEKQVPVKIQLGGRPSPEHEVRPAVIKPTDVFVDGARSRVARVVAAVAQVDTSGAREDILKAVPVRAVDADGQEVGGVAVRPRFVEVTVPVVALPPARTFKVQPQVVGEPAPGFTVEAVEVEPATVEVRAERLVLDSIAAVTTEALSVEGATQDVEGTLDVVLPAGAFRVSPERVTVRVRVVPATAARDLDRPVGVRGAPGHLSARVEPPTVSVQVTGPRDVVLGLAPEAVEAFVDVSNLAPGHHELPVLVTGPAGVNLTVSPERVRVTLEESAP